ncbi:hypothetical protein HQ545_00935 [Candidatus Woesearchaeota archaeon]|nr:hypothetical protein [Candidatus Woesearchaeota archaeon]
MKKTFVILLGLFLIFSTIAYADVITPKDVLIRVDAINNKITDLDKGYAEFNISITNNKDSTDSFKMLYLDPPNWYAQILPGTSARTVKLAPGDTGSIHMFVRPDKLKRGTYGIRALVQAIGTNYVYDDAVLRIVVGVDEDEIPPEPDLDVDVSVPAQMDPTGTYTVLVNIANNNKRLLENVKVSISSSIIADSTNVTIQPEDTKSISFAVLLMDNIKPQKDSLAITVDYEGEVFHDSVHNFDVVEYLPPFQTDIEVEKKWLKQIRTIRITNTGNALKSDSMRLETSLKERFFSNSDPKFRIVEQDKKSFLVWDASLEPDESMDITLTTSYRWLVLVAILIIVLLALRFAIPSPLLVKKKLRSVHKSHGGIADFSVIIYLQNRSKTALTNIRVVERVTKMVELKHDSFAGSLHPAKMHKHDNEGTLLEYRFGELAPGDERIIKYKAHSKLHIFGDITIKPTVVEFISGKGIKRKSRSRELSISTEETKEKK